MSGITRRRWNARGRLSQLACALAHLALALAVLSAIARPGGRYFYCEAFGLLPYDPCVEAARGDHARGALGTVSEHPSDCCEVLFVAPMPQAAQGVAPRIPVAPWAGLLPPLWPTSPAAAQAPSTERKLARWRPPPRAPNDLRAQLMVFLI